MSKPFIIINHHRSGSNFLCRLMKANSNIRCLNEPLSLHTNLFTKIDLEEMDDNDMQEYLQRHPEGEKFLNELRTYIYNSPYIAGFKETVLFGKMKWVLDYFPNVKVIYLVRNPLAVINSTLKNDMWRQWEYDKIIPQFLEHNGKEEDISSAVKLCSLSWKIRYELFKQEMDEQNYFMLKLEDLLLNPSQTLYDLMNYIDEDVDREQSKLINNLYQETRGHNYSVVRTKKDILDGWKDGLTCSDIDYIKEKLSDEMQELGYYV